MIKRQIPSRVGGDDTKTYQQPNARETEQFWTKLWQPRERDKKAECISSMIKEFEGLGEGLKAKIHIDLLRITLKNIKLDNARP